MSLLISEYVEGSSNNKAIELYNNSGSLVDLGANGYTLEFYFNGNTSAGTVIDLTGTVEDGEVFVIADNDADAAILAETDFTSNSSFFNGDDAIALRENGVVVDSLGQIGSDPGSEWGSGDTSTQNNTLRRNTLNISPDDFNPEKVQIDEDTGILPGFDFPEVDTGASLGDVTGVISYSFGNFEIYPTQPFSVTESNLTSEVTSIQSGDNELTVASYNVLNLDPNDSDGDTDVADGRYDAIANDIVDSLNISFKHVKM